MVKPNVIEEWRKFDEKKTPFIFPSDKELLNRDDFFEDIFSYEDFTLRLDEIKTAPSKLHLNLLPIPYIGNLEKAKLFILSANPGVGATDYKIQDDDESYRKILRNNIRQENFDDYPFFCLNPKYAWHGGFEYWEPRFMPIINELTKNKKWTYQKALHELSNMIAVIEYIPYHSESGPGRKNMESSRMIKNYVHQDLLPRARNNEIEIIVTRKVKEWGLNNVDHVIVYKPEQARSASLGIETTGGKRILQILGI